MATWIALLRGINVGGKNSLPMAELTTDLEELKLRNIQTYIQSGNVVFDSRAKSASSLASKIAKQLKARRGMDVRVVVLSREDLIAAVDSNPFTEAELSPGSLHFFFLPENPKAVDLMAINGQKSSKEKYKLAEKVFYLYAPDGIGRSRLAAKAEKFLGVSATARNFRTVSKILAILDSR